MAKPLRANRHELLLKTLEDDNPTVDVFFDEHRVWSTRLPEANRRTGLRRVPWPDAMAPYLHGVSTVTVRSSATGDDIASVHGGLRRTRAGSDHRRPGPLAGDEQVEPAGTFLRR